MYKHQKQLTIKCWFIIDKGAEEQSNNQRAPNSLSFTFHMGSLSSIPPALLLLPTSIFATTLHKVRNLTGIFALASWEMTTMLTRWACPFKCLFIHNFTCPVLWLNRNCITINLMICAAQQYGIHCAYLYSAQKEEIYFCLKIYMGISMSPLQIRGKHRVRY